MNPSRTVKLGLAACVTKAQNRYFPKPLPGRLIRRTAPFEGANAGAIPAPAANFRPVVKWDHVWLTPRSWRGRTFPGDQPSPRCGWAAIAAWRKQERAGL